MKPQHSHTYHTLTHFIIQFRLSSISLGAIKTLMHKGWRGGGVGKDHLLLGLAYLVSARLGAIIRYLVVR